MELPDLAQSIYALRNSDHPSKVILSDAAGGSPSGTPRGVLLFKPSSGYIPLNCITEILQRLVDRHRYALRAVTWWHGRDLQAHRLMPRHYPGFYRVAHGGLAALSAAAGASLHACYGDTAGMPPFARVFGSPFDSRLVRSPYDLMSAGVGPETLNQLWELDRSKEVRVKSIQRLDEDSFSLALTLPDDDRIPANLRNSPFILLNGFFAKLEKDFEKQGCIAIWIEQRPGSMTSWEDLRARFAGKTNPFLAPPGTVRGDAARGVLPVETVSILANVIHLSADEKEGRREVEEVWWEPSSFRQVFGSSGAPA